MKPPQAAWFVNTAAAMVNTTQIVLFIATIPFSLAPGQNDAPTALVAQIFHSGGCDAV
jgi:hypothetical protein